MNVESNFGFLTIDDDTAELFSTVNMAETNYTQYDYEGTLTKVRKVAENAARIIADRQYCDISERASFNEVLREIKGKIVFKSRRDREKRREKREKQKERNQKFVRKEEETTK